MDKVWTKFYCHFSFRGITLTCRELTSFVRSKGSDNDEATDFPYVAWAYAAVVESYFILGAANKSKITCIKFWMIYWKEVEEEYCQEHSEDYNTKEISMKYDKK